VKRQTGLRDKWSWTMPRQAIVTKYHGPSNKIDTRISATAQAGRIYRYWDHHLSIEDNHKAAAHAFAAKYGWHGEWVGGYLPSEDMAWTQNDKFSSVQVDKQ
jgi:hypothetical protein